MKTKETINKGGNPYLNGEPFRRELPIALKRMKKYLGSFEKAGRKNIYLIDNEGNPFYVWIVRAPSNLKFDSAISGIIKEHGNYPIYVYFTRDVKTYPRTAGKTYWDAIKKVYNKAGSKFKGAIMGIDQLNSELSELMLEQSKIKLDYRRYVDASKGVGLSLEQVLKEIGGLTPKKIKAVAAVIQLIK
jgi:hypothetical protein